QDRAITTEWSDQRTRLDAQAAEVNQVTGQLAELNKGLRNAYVAGTDAGVLLDQRDQLTMRLAELTGSTTSVQPDSTVEVRLGASGPLLVSGGTSYGVTVSGSADMDGVNPTPGPANPVTLTVAGSATPIVPPGGEMRGSYDVLTTDLPGYRSKLDAVAATLANEVNTQQRLGNDLNGAQGGPLFDPTKTTARDLTVQLSDPKLLAAANLGAGALDNTNANAMAGLDLGAKSYRELITSFGVAVSTSKQSAANQGVMAAQVDGSREALSGISIDEEMVNLLAAQRGYEGAARVLTAMDSMLDTLINRTGLR
ncbi:MAG: flagellar hook-associated protein FlgK, partial [Nocardioides sp.]